MNNEIKLISFKQSMAKLTPFLFKQSVAFFISEGRDEVSLGSGTLVSNRRQGIHSHGLSYYPRRSGERGLGFE